jgi:hypothetical protein
LAGSNSTTDPTEPGAISRPEGQPDGRMIGETEGEDGVGLLVVERV